MSANLFFPNHHEGLGLQVLTGVLAGLGVIGQLAGRADAVGDTMLLARELEYVSAQTYDVLYDPIIGRQVVDFETVPEGADFFSYDMYDGYAMVEWITNWASTVGNADTFKNRTTKQMRSFGGHYMYSDQDLRAAAFAGNGRTLDRERARHVRVGHEQKIDDLIATGDSTRSIEGLLNNSNIPTIVRAGSHTWTGGSVTVADIHADLTKLAQAPEQASAGNFVADTLLLPLSQKPLLSQPYSTLQGKSILAVWLEGQEDIKTVLWWKRANTASAIGGPRAFAFKRSKDVMKFLMAFDYREKPPQIEARAFVVHTEARVGGLCLVYPFGAAKMDLDA